jgi:hypothetical protein
MVIEPAEFAESGNVGTCRAREILGVKRKEENLKALREKIQASFERARGEEPPAVKKMSEEQRLTQQQNYCGPL